jgi:hypothetical protein
MADEIKPLNLEAETGIPEKTEKVKPDRGSGLETAVPVGKSKTEPKKKMIKLVLVLVLLGVTSGYGLFRLTQPSTPKRLKSSVEGEIVKGDAFGVMDEEAFRDVAEGKIASGGIDGEGSHHLVREGGASQNVYITSSIIDLDQFVDREVKVWGETFEAQKAGWLMDVGRLEILE